MARIDFFRILQSSSGIHYASQKDQTAFQRVMGGFLTAEAPSNYSLYEVCKNKGNSYSFSQDGSSTHQFLNLEKLVSGVEWILLNSAFRAMSCLGLHCGAVHRNGCTILIPGHSGSGKSTLILGFLLQGWTLISDEMTPIDTSNSMICGFPRSICIKEPSLDLFRSLDRHDLFEKNDYTYRMENVICVSPLAFPHLAENVCVKATALVFPSKTRSSTPSVKEMTKAGALARLSEHTIGREKFPTDLLRILAPIVDQSSCFELQSGPLESTLNLIESSI